MLELSPRWWFNAGMNTTPSSLLERLRQPGQDKSWERFADLYTPLLYYWARRLGLQEQDAADLVQEVFATLIQKLPLFAYDKDKTFRGWLRTVTINKWREKQRRLPPMPNADSADLAGMAGPDPAESYWEDEYKNHLVCRALEVMQADFKPETWKCCWETVVIGRAAADVAAELGLTVGAVHAAKFRVLSRLREELAGMMD